MRCVLLCAFLLFTSAVEVRIPVFAFYYPWYQTPVVSGKWGHWKVVFSEEEIERIRRDPEKAKKFEQFLSSKQQRLQMGVFLPEEDDYAELDANGLPLGRVTHHPLIGFYDSSDDRLIRTHFRWAKDAGIQAFIISWWGKDSFSDKVFQKMLNISEKVNGPFLTVYYEQAPEGRKEDTLNELVYILQQYAVREKFLRREEGPVIFIYSRAMNALNRLEWGEIAAELMQFSALLIGDVNDPYALPENFAGAHWYNPVEQILAKKDMKEEYADYVQRARDKGKLACIPVIPGYDDTKIRREGKKLDREGGELYVRLFEKARAAEPDCILITSWNEWHEGTEIEPSIEERDAYIRLTRLYTIVAP